MTRFWVRRKVRCHIGAVDFWCAGGLGGSPTSLSPGLFPTLVLMLVSMLLLILRVLGASAREFDHLRPG
jgi:hypothetical protein